MSIQVLSLIKAIEVAEVCLYELAIAKLQMLSLHNKPTLSLPLRLPLIPNKPGTLITRLLPSDDFERTTNYKHVHSSSFSSLSSVFVVHAVEKDSQQFEVDPDEAKAALQKLDQQLQTLSKKQVKPPKIKATDVKLTRGLTAEMPEISQSFLAYTAATLLAFTIFYNVLFYAVIKPSIDGPDDVAEPTPASTMETQSPNAAVLQSLLSLPKDFLQR